MLFCFDFMLIKLMQSRNWCLRQTLSNSLSYPSLRNLGIAELRYVAPI